MMPYSDPDLLDISTSWGILPGRVRHDIAVAGSPERCLFRFVIEDLNRDLYLLENISLKDGNRKKEIIQTLKLLHKRGLGFINPYMSDSGNREIIEFNGSGWQMSKFLNGVELKRPDYVFDGWRGELMAEMLGQLAVNTREISLPHPDMIFSIKSFVYDLMTKMSHYAPEIHHRVLPVADFLEKKFMKIHDQLPIGFCHGDFHPLNIIWSKTGTTALIDWEFSGYKPEIYDTALLVGCLGMEDPDCLSEELVQRLLHRIKKEEIYAPLSLAYLPEFIIAIRFAWLSEWLRKNDHEMIALECDYMDLLMDNGNIFKEIWELRP